MAKGSPDVRARFVPRVTLTALLGGVLFLASAGLYALPALREPLPPGAIASYREERVKARLEGKVIWFLAGSLVAASLIVSLPTVRTRR